MSWQGVTVIEQRQNFIRDWQTGYYSVTDLAERFSISRKTAHRWINRFLEYGRQGYEELSRKPHTIPNQTEEYVRVELLQRKKRRPSKGAKKLVDRTGEEHPEWPLPSVAMANRILNREELVKRRRRTQRLHPGYPKSVASRPNEIWALDYKGQFKLLDGTVCYPMMVSDLDSRYVLGVEGHHSANHDETKRYLTPVFRENGLPERIRSDNGIPFASSAIARLSRLSVWFIKLGIYPELVEPGKPQQNGIHERMH